MFLGFRWFLGFSGFLGFRWFLGFSGFLGFRGSLGFSGFVGFRVFRVWCFQGFGRFFGFWEVVRV